MPNAPFVAANGAGERVIGWSVNHPTIIRGLRRDPYGRLGPVFTLAADGEVTPPRVGLDRPGRLLLPMQRNSPPKEPALLVGRPQDGPLAAYPLAGLPYVTLDDVAMNDRGDAIIAWRRSGPDRTLVALSSRGKPFGAPIVLEPKPWLVPPSSYVDYPFVVAPIRVAVGPDGAVVVAAFHDGVLTTWSGNAGSGLAKARAVASGGGDGLAVTIDSAGTTIVALTRDDNRRPRPRRPFASVAVLQRRRGGRFGRPQTVQRGLGAYGAVLARTGRTAALAWVSRGARLEGDRVRASMRAADGRFGPAQRLSPASSRIGPPQPPVIAVSRAGDALVAYMYSNGTSDQEVVYANVRRAGTTRFDPPEVLSRLGEGGSPVATVDPDGTAFALWAGSGGVLARARDRAEPPARRGPDLRPPGLTATPILERDVRDDGKVSTTVRCARRCLVQANATLRVDGRWRGDASAGPTIIGSGGSSTLRFALLRPGRPLPGPKEQVAVDVRVDAMTVVGVHTVRTQRVNPPVNPLTGEVIGGNRGRVGARR